MNNQNDEIKKKIKEVLGVRENAPFLKHGFELTELANFAIARHGWGDSDGGFGVIYPSDLDEYDKEVEGMDIREGYVEIYGFGGAEKGGYEFKVKEIKYIQELIKILRHEGYIEESKALESLV